MLPAAAWAHPHPPPCASSLWNLPHPELQSSEVPQSPGAQHPKPSVRRQVQVQGPRGWPVQAGTRQAPGSTQAGHASFLPGAASRGLGDSERPGRRVPGTGRRAWPGGRRRNPAAGGGQSFECGPVGHPARPRPCLPPPGLAQATHLTGRPWREAGEPDLAGARGGPGSRSHRGAGCPCLVGTEKAVRVRRQEGISRAGRRRAGGGARKITFISVSQQGPLDE